MSAVADVVTFDEVAYDARREEAEYERWEARPVD